MKNKRLKILLPLLVVMVVLGSLVTALPASAASFDTVTVTATPAFMSISIENLGTGADDAWLLNGFATAPGDGKADTSTTYYSNLLGDTTVPTESTVAQAECGYLLTDTSTVVIQLKATMPDFTGGDAMTNGLGTPAANAFAAWVWKMGDTYSSGKKIIPVSGATSFFLGAAAGDGDIYFGFTLSTKTDAAGWTSGTNETSTITITASRYTP